MKKNDECEERKKLAFSIFLIALIVYGSVIILLWDMQFNFDEGAYALMVKEFSANPAMVMPSVTGEHPEWKPPLFTWIYSMFYFFLKFLPIPVEAIMRLPSAFFGAGAAAFVFLLGDKLYGKWAGVFSAGVFLSCIIVAFDSTLMMMEALSLFLIAGSLYFYMSGKKGAGMALLGMLVLTKWLYAGIPILFLVAYYWKREEFKEIALSFLVVPAALLSYLALAFAFGDGAQALSVLFWDMFRVSGAGITGKINNIYDAFLLLFPYSAFFFIGAIASSKKFKEILPVFLIGSAFVLIPLAGQYIFWYLSPAVIGIAVLIGRAASKSGNPKEVVALMAILLIFSAVAQAWYFNGTYWKEETGFRDVAEFMKGKSVEFIEPGPPISAWASTNERYMNTDAERMALEQHNPGLLFYRFGESSDYENLKITFIAGMNGTYAPTCQEYMVVHEKNRFWNVNATVQMPKCMRFLFRNGNYAVYGGE